MTLAEDRVAIAAAMDGLPGVRATYPRPTGRYQKGDAFPIFVELNSDGFGSGAVTWAATVVLGQDLAGAEEMLDELLDPLRAALRREMTLGRFTIGTMDVTGGQILLAQQTGIREHGAG